jgi:Galactose-3-O-sulfotransferase
MPTTPRTVIFLHIPKTGGTTFCKILQRKYAPKETRTFNGDRHHAEIERFVNSVESERSKYRLIQGHLHFGLHEFVPGDSTYVTCLREPIARALSFYSHVRTRSDHYLHRRLIDERLDLKGLLNQHGTPELFNHQTRMIAGRGKNSNSEVDRSTLERAKENLVTKFCFVGLTEQFDASLILLSRMFGWNAPLYIKRNVTSRKIDPESVDAETSRLLRQANALDLELHEFARTLFEAQRCAAGPAFETKLHNFQRRNAMRARAHRNYERILATLKSLITFGRNSDLVDALKESPGGPSI